MATVPLEPLTVLDARSAPAAPATQPMAAPTLPPTVVASPLKRWFLQSLISRSEAVVLLKHYGSPRKAWQARQQLREIRAKFYDGFSLTKLARVDGRYYRGYNVPGWPSAAYNARMLPRLEGQIPPLRRAFGRWLVVESRGAVSQSPLSADSGYFAPATGCRLWISR